MAWICSEEAFSNKAFEKPVVFLMNLTIASLLPLRNSVQMIWASFNSLS
jgi:hypothetical protein